MNPTTTINMSYQHEQLQPFSTDFMATPKLSFREFVLTELCVYLSQVLMFFFVAVLVSNFLRDEKYLLAYMESKANANTAFEVAATMLAIAATVGVLAVIAKAVPESSLLSRIADEVLNEIPRTAYTFGSSVTGTMLAVAWFVGIYRPSASNPVSFWLGIAAVAATTGFMYGCSFAVGLKRKSHIKPSPGGSPR